jgi:50S ribosomal subunit-associated GTPase HflX
MSKRLQVVLTDEEYEELRNVSSAAGMTVSEWVRQALRKMRRDHSLLEADGKIEAIRAATKHEFPSGDVATMLDEIEAGYLQ